MKNQIGIIKINTFEYPTNIKDMKKTFNEKILKIIEKDLEENKFGNMKIKWISKQSEYLLFVKKYPLKKESTFRHNPTNSFINYFISFNNYESTISILRNVSGYFSFIGDKKWEIENKSDYEKLAEFIMGGE